MVHLTKEFRSDLDGAPKPIRATAERIMQRLAAEPHVGKKLFRPSAITRQAVFGTRVGGTHRLVYRMKGSVIEILRLIALRDSRLVGLNR